MTSTVWHHRCLSECATIAASAQLNWNIDCLQHKLYVLNSTVLVRKVIFYYISFIQSEQLTIAPLQDTYSKVPQAQLQ